MGRGIIRKKRPGLYEPAFVMPVAAIIALIGLYWTLQRVGILQQ